MLTYLLTNNLSLNFSPQSKKFQHFSEQKTKKGSSGHKENGFESPVKKVKKQKRTQVLILQQVGAHFSR